MDSREKENDERRRKREKGRIAGMQKMREETKKGEGKQEERK